MSDLDYELNERVGCLTLNRIDKHNAFDDNLLADMQEKLDQAIADPEVSIIVLKANGLHFSAGADLNWMQRMATFSEKENLNDALVLARVMYTLHTSPKPTLALVQGSAFGGGAGLVAACDMAIAANNAQFCFSEVKLGLVPAVISPYVVEAIGSRAARHLFMTAERFNAHKALSLQLVQHCVDEDELLAYGLDYAKKIARLAPMAVSDCKTLVATVVNQAIDEKLLKITAGIIAKKRVSDEGQKGLKAFLNKETPNWN